MDSLNILPSITQFPDQCRQTITEMSQLSIPAAFSSVKNIVVSGMGGSALPGRIVAGLERQHLRVPLIVSTEYHLPNFVSADTLVVLTSYSGNTIEAITSLGEATARGAQVFVITGGGQLAQLMTDRHISGYSFTPHFNPSGQPRMGLGYSVTATLLLLARSNLITPLTDLGQLPDFLAGLQPGLSNLTGLAQSLAGKIPVLVASEHLKGAAHAVKNMINENGKNFVCLFDLPELDHHLLEGLSFPKTNPDHLFFVFITSPKYHPEVLKRYPITQDVVNRQHIPYLVREYSSPSRLFDIMQLLQEGAYLSYTLSQLNGIDPGPIPWVDYLKDEIRKVV